MGDESFDLVFAGQLVRGAELGQAKKNIGQLFKVSEAKVDALFSGKPVTLKKGLDFATANKYRVAIKKAGCRVDVVEQRAASGSVAGSEKADAGAHDLGVSENKRNDSSPSNSYETRNNQVNSQAQEPPNHSSEEKHVSDGNAKMRTTSPSLDEDQPPLPQVEEMDADAEAASAFAARTHDPADDQIERDLVALASTVSASSSLGDSLSVAPAEGNLVEVEELEHPEPVHIEVTGISVQEPGSDLLTDDEKTSFVPRDIAMHADLAPVGAELVRESEREIVEPVIVDVSGISVAAPGTDLGEERDERPKVQPDISHLSLE